MRLMMVVGVRPQVIKAAPLIDLLSRDSEVDFQLVHSGQHYDYEMSKVFFNELNLPDPIVNLEVGSGSHAEQTANIMLRIEPVIEKLKPDVVVVLGDANTTLAGALAAVKMRIPVAHVEAGLRSWDLSMPEEVNRVLTDHCSQVLYAPTKVAVRNLRSEGIPEYMILQSGDTMYDSILRHLKDVESSKILDELGISDEPFIVVTAHRAENVDFFDNLSKIVSALLKLRRVKIIFPVHPRTMKRLVEFDLKRKLEKASHIIMTKPVGYFDMLRLIKDAKAVLTDSGGIQKEAFILGTPCVTMRSRTEWVETIMLGGNVLVGADERLIVKEVMHAISNSDAIEKRLLSIPKPYGDGCASEKIVEDLKKRYFSGELKVGPIKPFQMAFSSKP